MSSAFTTFTTFTDTNGSLALRLAAAVQRRSTTSSAAAAVGAATDAVPPPPLRVLILHGQDDALVPLANSERLARLMPPGCGCELLVVEHCGHLPQEEWPEAFAKLVSEFVMRGKSP